MKQDFLIDRFSGNQIGVRFVEANFDQEYFRARFEQVYWQKDLVTETADSKDARACSSFNSKRIVPLFSGISNEAVQMDPGKRSLRLVITETKYPNWCAQLRAVPSSRFQGHERMHSVREMNWLTWSRIATFKIAHFENGDTFYGVSLVDSTYMHLLQGYGQLTHYIWNEKWSGKWHYDNLNAPSHFLLEPYFKGVEFGARGRSRFNETHIRQIFNNLGIDFTAPDLFTGRYFYL